MASSELTGTQKRMKVISKNNTNECAGKNISQNTEDRNQEHVKNILEESKYVSQTKQKYTGLDIYTKANYRKENKLKKGHTYVLLRPTKSIRKLEEKTHGKPREEQEIIEVIKAMQHRN